MSAAPEAEYQPSADPGSEAGSTANTTQNDYKSRTGQSTIPVQSDEAPADGPYDTAHRSQTDSDAQLRKSAPAPAVNHTDSLSEQDDKEAIDQSNIVEGRTRGATKQAGTYQEPGDTEGLPENDGTSAVSGGPI